MRNNYTVSENKYRANNIVRVCATRVFQIRQVGRKTIAEVMSRSLIVKYFKKLYIYIYIIGMYIQFEQYLY